GVIKEKYHLSALTWTVPHVFACVTSRQILFRHVEQDELDLKSDDLLPDTVHLLLRPLREELADPKTLLLRYWRLLFHIHVHAPLESLPETPAEWQRRLQALGSADFAEIRQVLIQDGLIPASADARVAFIEFASVFLEYYHFAPDLLPQFFPRLTHH